jgi:hypothetical protein
MLLTSSEACGWLRALFLDMAAHRSTQRTMTDEPAVEIANVREIQLVNRSEGPRVSFRRTGSGESRSFVWSANPDGWTYMADLVESLCKGGGGHHYLTDDKEDDATVELSFGEPDVRAAAIANGIFQPKESAR